MSSQLQRRLAARYAPILTQKVSHEWVAADQIAPIDFAGSIEKVSANPGLLMRVSPNYLIPNPKIYYSVCETTTHYFLIYAVYHILDWWKRLKPDNLYDLIRDSLDEHVHDMEGALLVVTKERGNAVDGLVTVGHRDFYLYTAPTQLKSDRKTAQASGRESLRLVKFNETVDGYIWVDRATDRPRLYIQSRGHGIRGDHKGWGSGDEVWYYRPSGERQDPSHFNTHDTTKLVDYELEDIFVRGGLWANRFNRRVFRQNPRGQWAFVHREKLTRGKLEAGAANPPWSWNDHNDTSPIGEIATDPAEFITRYAQGWGPVSRHYLQNPYLSI